MTGICGWNVATHAAESERVNLQAMIRLLPPRDQVQHEIFGTHHAICDQSDHEGHLYQDNQLTVAVDGKPVVAGSTDAPLAQQIANLYVQHGIDFLTHIGGTFAIALLDHHNQRTVLATDRFGVRPLAYATIADGIVFGSTATAVYAHPSVTRGADHQSLFNYVYFHMIPSPRTVFAAISKIPPAHRVVFEHGKVTTSRYWTPDYQRKTAGQLRGELIPTLDDSVKRASDNGRAGSFLSGGLDSSTVSGLLQRHTPDKANVFTIGFAQEGYDELEFARLAANHFGLNLTEYYISTDDVHQAVSEVAQAYDEPFGNSSAVPTLVCARLAKANGIDTLLAGDGGDELFGGNDRYATQKLFAYYSHVPGWLDKHVLTPFFSRPSVQRSSSGFQHKVRRYIEQAHMAMPARTQNYNLLHLLGAEAVFTPEFLSGVNAHEPGEALHKEYWQHGPPDQLERLLLMDYKFTLADNDLRKVNRMCELANVDVRYPMLDDQLVAFSNTIPSNVKLRRQELRSYFKRETEQFLPSEIINKTKQGFGLPFGEWAKQDANLSALIERNIDRLRGRDMFNSAFIDDLTHKHQNEHAAYYGGLVWVLTMLEEWLETHDLTL